MRVLLTGANGHVGANTAPALIEMGHHVIAFVRQESDLRGLEGVDVEYAYGDITDGESVITAATNCDAIVHTAAIYQWWAKDLSTIIDTAVNGTNNVLEAAKQANIERLVYTSSVVAIGTTKDKDKPLTVNDWNDEAHTPYAKAKTISERKAWELATEYGIPMIALCPGTIFGPLDYRITPSTNIILGMADGSGQSADVGIASVDVRDIGKIHAQALEQGTSGNRYAIVGANVTLVELAKLVTGFTGTEVKHFGGNLMVGKMIAGAMELGARFSGKSPALTRAYLDDYVGRYQYVDATSTREEFNWRPVDLRDTVRVTLDWLVQIGKLDASVIAAAK